MLGIDAQVERQFDRLIELGVSAGLNQLHGLFHRVALAAVQTVGDFLVTLGDFAMALNPSP
jgi:hypothetical protein